MSISEFLNAATKTAKKKTGVLEINIEDSFVKYAKRSCCVAMKLILLNKRGWPDRTVLCPGGNIFFIEFKKPGVKKIAPTQGRVRVALENLGFKYHVCNTPGQAEKILRDTIDEVIE